MLSFEHFKKIQKIGPRKQFILELSSNPAYQHIGTC